MIRETERKLMEMLIKVNDPARKDYSSLAEICGTADNLVRFIARGTIAAIAKDQDVAETFRRAFSNETGTPI